MEKDDFPCLHNADAHVIGYVFVAIVCGLFWFAIGYILGGL